MKFQTFEIIVLIIPLTIAKLSFHAKVRVFELKGEFIIIFLKKH